MASSMGYNPDVILEFARRLYARAASIVAIYFVLGVLAGSLTGLGVSEPGSNRALIVMVLVAIGAALGYAIGSERAFVLRLQAQTALCQVQIEHNTRAAAAASRLQAQHA